MQPPQHPSQQHIPAPQQQQPVQQQQHPHPHSLSQQAQPEIPRAPSVVGRVPTPVTGMPPHRRPTVNAKAGAVNTPSPAAAATPAPTPNTSAASPKTPKSPGKKQQAKKAPPKGRKVTGGQGAAPSPQATAPTPEASGSAKRPRTEDTSQEDVKPQIAPSPAAMVGQTPPNKRARLSTEWEIPAEGAPVQEPVVVKNEIIDKSGDEIISELAGLLNGTESQMMQDTFKALANEFPFDAGPSSSSQTTTYPKVESYQVPADVFEFFDFVSYDEDAAAVANTPDLVAAANTGPTNSSPESAPDESLAAKNAILEKSKDAGVNATSSKSSSASGTNPGHSFDSSALLLNEIDPSVAQYLQMDDWSWTGTMPTSDWAISTTT
jgi:hypothetical protein